MTIDQLIDALQDLRPSLTSKEVNSPVYISVWTGSDGWEDNYLTGVSVTYKGVELDYE